LEVKIVKSILTVLALIVAIVALAAADSSKIEQSSPSGSFEQMVDRISMREAALAKNLRDYAPLVETYIQTMRSDRELGAVPTRDQYFLDKLSFNGIPQQKSFLKQAGLGSRMLGKLTGLYRMQFLPLGFAQMIIPDQRGFDRQNYDFKFVRREFLGDLRCLVIDVAPKKDSGKGRFLGRIWVEDQDYNIVRFNGTFTPAPFNGRYLHFDSWRLNMQPGLWLPAYIYSEESDLPYHLAQHMRFKAQTRLWGYDLLRAGRHEEYASVLVDSYLASDHSEKAQDATPVQAQREWERLAEQNVIDRLEYAGLLAPEGEVDKVLTTVVSNLEITNNLDIQPPVRARVLLTTPLESFTIGHTVIVSKGLLDVLPDEATLAMVLSHELAHISLGHRFDTKYAFSDRMIFPDDKSLQKVNFHRDQAEESEADERAITYLENSPYKDKLSSAGLFLKQLQARSGELPELVRAHMGNGMFASNRVRLGMLMSTAPQLEPRKVDQIASLPLGGRVHLNPWDDHIQLAKGKPVPLLTAREKMPFEVTPVFPYLTRMDRKSPESVAGNVKP
jgi:hypothetical protein